jgi:GrpB-like predicted nucleotidyltransferase (UPF0157 family)
MTQHIGLPDDVVRIVPAQSDWRTMFQDTCGRLKKVLADHHPIIEHIGSTSVPGLAAKPIIDVAIAIATMPPDAGLMQVMADAGFPRQREVLPGWWSFNEGNPAKHHIHMVAKGGDRLRDLLAFRDALRSDPEMMRRYAALKLELARRFPHNTRGYREGKNAFIRAAIGR